MRTFIPFAPLFSLFFSPQDRSIGHETVTRVRRYGGKWEVVGGRRRPFKTFHWLSVQHVTPPKYANETRKKS